jgi:hypothetical protein
LDSRIFAERIYIFQSLNIWRLIASPSFISGAVQPHDYALHYLGKAAQQTLTVISNKSLAISHP